MADLDAKVITTAHTDYAHRIIVNADQLHRVFDLLEHSVNYSNVKGMVATLPGEAKYEAAMHHGWSIMADLQASKPWSGVSTEGGVRDDSHRDTLAHDPESERSALYDAEPPAPEVVRAKQGGGRKPKRDGQRTLDV